jgi:hypothetical protein
MGLGARGQWAVSNIGGLLLRIENVFLFERNRKLPYGVGGPVGSLMHWKFSLRVEKLRVNSKQWGSGQL